MIDEVTKAAIRSNVSGIAGYLQFVTLQEVIATAFVKCQPTADNLAPREVRELLRNPGQYTFNHPPTFQLLSEAVQEFTALLPADAAEIKRDDTPLTAPAEGSAKRWAIRLFSIANAKLAVAYAVAMANAWSDIHGKPHPDRRDILVASLGTWASGLIRIPERRQPQEDRRHDRDDHRRTETPYRPPQDTRKSGRRD